MASKTYDAEETKEERAQRLIAAKVEKAAGENRVIRRRLRDYGAHLSRHQRQMLAKHLERELDRTLAILKDIDDEPTGFSFTPDFVDDDE